MDQVQVELNFRTNSEGEDYVNRSDLVSLLQEVLVNQDMLSDERFPKTAEMAFQWFIRTLTRYGCPEVDWSKEGNYVCGTLYLKDSEGLRYYYEQNEDVFFGLKSLFTFIDEMEKDHLELLKKYNAPPEYNCSGGFELLRKVFAHCQKQLKESRGE